jgi:N-acylneuraminate cytidylyltransferase
VRHALATLDETFDFIVVLQPTSPLRVPEDIDGAVQLCIESGAPACVSVVEAEKPPQWSFARAPEGLLAPLISEHHFVQRRQDLPASYSLNGAVYVARSDWIANNDSFVGPNTVGYVMPMERSVDIDSELDLIVAEALERYITLRDAATPAEDRETALR